MIGASNWPICQLQADLHINFQLKYLELKNDNNDHCMTMKNETMITSYKDKFSGKNKKTAHNAHNWCTPCRNHDYKRKCLSHTVIEKKNENK